MPGGAGSLDEFFEVRVAGLRQQRSLGLDPRTADRLTPNETLERMRAGPRREPDPPEVIERRQALCNELAIRAA